MGATLVEEGTLMIHWKLLLIRPVEILLLSFRLDQKAPSECGSCKLGREREGQSKLSRVV